MAHPICSPSLIARSPFVIMRSMVPFTATCAAVMGASDAALANTPRYHPAIDVGNARPSCTQILNVIKGTASDERDAIASHVVSRRASSRFILSEDERHLVTTGRHLPSISSPRASRWRHALCTHVSTIPPNAPTARFSASDSGRRVVGVDIASDCVSRGGLGDASGTRVRYSTRTYGTFYSTFYTIVVLNIILYGLYGYEVRILWRPGPRGRSRDGRRAPDRVDDVHRPRACEGCVVKIFISRVRAPRASVATSRRAHYE